MVSYSLPCICPIIQRVLSHMLGQVASNKHFIFTHITNYRDVSYENIYVVSMSTVTMGRAGEVASSQVWRLVNGLVCHREWTDFAKFLNFNN